MGKRKHRPDFNKTPPSEVKTYSAKMDPTSKEKSTHSIKRHTQKSLASIIDIMDNSEKRQSSSYHSHQNQYRSSFLTKSRNFYGFQYSRRKSSNNCGASSSHVKSGEKVWLRKAFTQSDIDSNYHKENKEKYCRQERTRTSSSVSDAETLKLVCGLCERSLKTKPFIFENTISCGELSVVAVLVCGHLYHTDCLEQKTRYGDIRDPPCPLCACTN